MMSPDPQTHSASTGCPCCRSGVERVAEADGWLSRRHFLLGAGAAAAVGGWAVATRRAHADPAGATEQPVIAPAEKLVVQPVLTYATPRRRQQTSWRPWGGIQTEDDAVAERKRIEAELREMVASHRLAVEMKPVIGVRTPEEAATVRNTACDATLVYAAGAGRPVLDALLAPDRPTVFFLRHRSGPVSLWYEILHPHFFRQATDEYKQPAVNVDDVVVDEYADLAWRLRALAALRQTVGQPIVAIGGAGGWGEGHQLAPRLAREKWHLDIRDVSYEELGKRIERAKHDDQAVAAAGRQADEYLRQPGIELHTDRKYVANAFLLCRVFKDLLAEHKAQALTVQHCMGTIMPISETTACLPLSLLNDEGYLAFCESDFVVIPSGMLMQRIMGTPVFLNDPTWPHHGVVTLAHCTAPRKMDGKTAEPTKILTHFESDYGAAPKVAMCEGQIVTMAVPDFHAARWVGLKGSIVGSPFHAICRSQIDVAVEGDMERLVRDMRGFHWMLVYGDCRREVGYAIRRLGIEWEDISA
jgi:hypothetical protein